jgi:hypothetical protein
MGAYDTGPCVTAYEATLQAYHEASRRTREASDAAVKESLAPFFRENPVLRAVTWETSAEYDDQGGTYTSLSVRIDTADDKTPLLYEGGEVSEDDLEQTSTNFSRRRSARKTSSPSWTGTRASRAWRGRTSSPTWRHRVRVRVSSPSIWNPSPPRIGSPDL